MPIFKKNIFSPKQYVKEDQDTRMHRLIRARRGLAISNIFLFLGILVLLYFVVNPLYKSIFGKPEALKIVKPFSGTVMGVAYNSVSEDFYFTELSDNSENTSAVRNASAPYNEFYLSIPKLGINKALVKVNSTEVNPEGFIGHYKGTALPGETGNSFLYGHSTLPLFYDPSDYKAVFTKIPQLEPGDVFSVYVGSQELKYVVKMGKELLPEEINPYGAYYPSLYNRSTVTLMTCTPPGTKKNRYIVLAELR